MKRSERGQALVEFSVLLPVLLILMMGIVDVARMAGSYLVVVHATREATRLAITGAPEDEIRERVFDVGGTLEADRVTITVTPAGGSTVPGSDVQVEVAYTYQVMTIHWIIGTEVPLTSVLKARVE